MKVKFCHKNLEKGQVLPIVVISLFALIAMAALMIDGGMLLSHRRTAQAAADAGALAGAKSLCPTADYSKDTAKAVALQYVAQNKAEWIELSPEIQFPDDSTIHVETSVSSGAFFARIFGQLGLTASAMAEANCSSASSARVLPIAFPCYPEEFYEGQDDIITYPSSDTDACYVRYGDPSESIQWNIENKRMIIVMDTKDVTDGTLEVSYCHPDGPIDCSSTESELRSIFIGDQNRGWLSLDGSGGAGDLCSWVHPGFDGLLKRGTWLSSQPGNRSNLWAQPQCLQMIIGKQVTVPIFNQWCYADDPEFHVNCDGKWLDGDTKILSGGMKFQYRIEGFGTFVLTCAYGGPNKDCPYRTYLYENGLFKDNEDKDKDKQYKNISSIEGYFVKGTTPFGGGPGVNLGTFVVQLTK